MIRELEERKSTVRAIIVLTVLFVLIAVSVACLAADFYGFDNIEFVAVVSGAIPVVIVPVLFYIFLKPLREIRVREEKVNSILAEIKHLQGLVSICANCHRIKDENGNWCTLEDVLKSKLNTQLSHGICPDCAESEFDQHKDIK
jgi:hypothetical protein